MRQPDRRCAMQINQRPSPSHSSRHDAAISMIVVHASVGSFASALSWLCNPAARVSAHYLIAKNGSCYQLVADDQAAWHAGASSWLGMDSLAIQYASIGIELANLNTGSDPYPPAQLATAHDLCALLIARYAIERRMVVRHLDIAPGRKSDPAGFPWAMFVDALYPPAAMRYRVLGIPVYQSSTRTGALWGHLLSGEVIAIDDMTNGHLADGRGFIRLDQGTLESL